MSRGRRTSPRAGTTARNAERIVEGLIASTDGQIHGDLISRLLWGLGLERGAGEDSPLPADHLLRDAVAAYSHPGGLTSTDIWLQQLAGVAAAAGEATRHLVPVLLERVLAVQLEIVARLEAAAPLPRSADHRRFLAAMDMRSARTRDVLSMAQRHRKDSDATRADLADLDAAIIRRGHWTLESDFDQGRRRREALAGALGECLRGPAPESARELLAFYWERVGDTARAAEVAAMPALNLVRAGRLLRAHDIAGLEVPIDLTEDIPILDEPAMDMYRIDRLSGLRGERAHSKVTRRWRGLHRIDTASSAEQFSATVAHMLLAPEDYAYDHPPFREPGREDGPLELLVPVDGRGLEELCRRFAGRRGVSLRLEVNADQPSGGRTQPALTLRMVTEDHAGNRFAVGASRVSGSLTRSRTRAGLLAAAGVKSLDLAGMEVEPGVASPAAAPRAAYRAPAAGEDSDPDLYREILGRQRCAHPSGSWAPSGDGTAMVLGCSACRRRALAAVPLHRMPELNLRGMSEEAYLRRERFHAALDGVDLPERITIEQLRVRDGVIESLDPARFALDTRPAPRPARTDSLSQALGSRARRSLPRG